MYIPDVEHCIDVLGGFGYRNLGSIYTYDDRSYEVIDEIFELLKRIKHDKDPSVWTLWLKAERGPIEAWSSFEDQKEYNDIKTYEEYEKSFEWQYPHKEEWYYFQALEEKNGYRAIFLEHKHVIQIDPEIEGKSYPYEITEFVEWLRDSIKACIEMLENGTYNDYVNDNLPPRHRTGTIIRRDLWDIFPELREEHYEEISQEEIDEILKFIAEQPKEAHLVPNKLPTMTANDFYRFCSLGYIANNYDWTDLPVNEQYRKHADGRDSGLSQINPDSATEFYSWLTDRENYSGHPFEVCRGGNSTHISLYPHFIDNGYVLVLSGESIGRSNETVKFYNALKKQGLPVFLNHGELLASRLREEEKVGIVPKGVFPRYCHSYFPGEDVISFMNFPYEEEYEEAMNAKAIWQRIEEIELAGDNNE